MLWAGLVALALALGGYFVFEPTLWTLFTSAAEILGVIALFALVCLSESTSN